MSDYSFDLLHLRLCKIYKIQFKARMFSNMFVNMLADGIDLGREIVTEKEELRLRVKYSKEEANGMVRLFKLENL